MDAYIIFVRDNFILLFFAASLSFLIGVKLISLLVRYLWWRHTQGEEYFDTTPSAIADIAGFLKKKKLTSSLLYDFGSSHGVFIFSLLKHCPGLKTVGIEHDIVKIRYARFENFFRIFRPSPQFIHGDFFTEDISQADIIFVYVPRLFLPQIEEKLRKEMKPGGIAITYRINLPNWQPDEIIPTDFVNSKSHNNLYIYSQVNGIS